MAKDLGSNRKSHSCHCLKGQGEADNVTREPGRSYAMERNWGKNEGPPESLKTMRRS
jgi:hypothetical protein